MDSKDTLSYESRKTFDRKRHIERIMIHATNEDDVPSLWKNLIQPLTIVQPLIPPPTDNGVQSIDVDKPDDEKSKDEIKEQIQGEQIEEENEDEPEMEESEEDISPRYFSRGPWMDLSNMEYGRGKRNTALLAEVISVTEDLRSLENTEMAMVVLSEDDPTNYNEAMRSKNAEKWKKACEDEYKVLRGYCTWNLVEQPPNINILSSQWSFRVKQDN